MAEEKEKTQGQLLEEKLLYKKKNFFEISSKEEIDQMYEYAKGYMAYLDAGKTEREAVAVAIEMAKKAGYTEYKLGDALKAGDKKYFNNRDKSVAVFKIGTNDLEKDGVRIVAAHVDAPRIDIKQNPLYEDSGMCFLKTHYYGGIKKYQWTAIPLALHGVVVLADGTRK